MYKTVIYNAKVVLKDRVLDSAAVVIEGNKISKIDEMYVKENYYEVDEMIDARGNYVMPGFIDLHSDNIERVAQPRPQSLIDFNVAICEQEKQLVCQGITSMYHSLTIMDGTVAAGKSESPKTALRTPENHKKLVEVIRKHNDGDHLIRHRFHCRFDITNVDGYDMLVKFIDNKEMQLLSFVDHTPGQGQYRDIQFFKDHVIGNSKSEEDKDKYLEERMNTAKLTANQICTAANMAKEAGIPIASHDDESIEKLDYVTENLHVNICEFPLELEVAKEAHERGLKVVVGANNILMGRSHSNNLSALDAIKANCADILVSDYFPAALLHSIFKIYDMGITTLPDAVNLATYNPACAVRVDDILGSIEEGKLADLLIVSYEAKKPVILTAFVDGEKVMDIHYRSKIAI
ncbi:alpha-D-ribose 1-methylphosphonate 5-triphosphate diphosphatase [Anaerosporobacter sp.]|uniref:alpha-D-ribose 1-methylphosphonate 5-triphosphate diphosphatase n=1 Tax=Anaerosporobacter sp. TaxID=1872529 RepID=UPI00286F1988|nr:alpha-D-ribose 1-methylphosphonate 5-triphosphate diphosphatase [Anaerosporobacter sp.]